MTAKMMLEQDVIRSVTLDAIDRVDESKSCKRLGFTHENRGSWL